ncbi:putative odorant-binding protein A5 isoform X1 [Planococcus citri]|uniref:putative odorant-binding protein A5 isoform X1 n=1 Tax=Planococcus citri TaxID=170843 RepID=UPI0031F866D8
MLNDYFQFFALFFIIFWQEHEAVKDINQIFLSEDLVPKFIPHAPKEYCTVIFQPNVIISTGEHYRQYQTLNEPEVRWNASDDKFYTLYLAGVSNIDFVYPDQVFVCEPNRFPRGEWIQWIVTDIPGEKISKGKILYPFANFSNPSDIVRQAYVFLVFEHVQKPMLEIKNEKQKQQRFTYAHLEHDFTPVRHFMKKLKNATLLAGNFFYLILDPISSTRVPQEKTTITS